MINGPESTLELNQILINLIVRTAVVLGVRELSFYEIEAIKKESRIDLSEWVCKWGD
jgi:hypothetical protein